MENNLKNQHYKNMSIMPQMEILTFEAETYPYIVVQTEDVKKDVLFK